MEEVRPGWGFRAMSLALILGGRKTRLVFSMPIGHHGEAGLAYGRRRGRPLKGLRWRCWVQGRGPLECALKGGIWEREKGTWGQPKCWGRGVRPGPLVPTEPLKAGASRSRHPALSCPPKGYTQVRTPSSEQAESAPPWALSLTQHCRQSGTAGASPLPAPPTTAAHPVFLHCPTPAGNTSHFSIQTLSTKGFF